MGGDTETGVMPSIHANKVVQFNLFTQHCFYHLLILLGKKCKDDHSDNFMELFLFLECAEERASEREARMRERTGAMC